VKATNPLATSLHTYNPAEIFIYQPDLVINMAIEMKEA
jgi:hypothetical protein